MKCRRVLRVSRNIVMIIVNEMVNDTLIFSDIMHTSKGREKVFSLIQYLMDLYVKCMAHSVKFSQLVK